MMINLKNLKKQYRDFTLDLDSLDVDEGKITGLVGCNGSGKTTTFRLLAGLCKADNGIAKVLDHDAWDCPVSVKSQIGVVFSDSGFQECFTAENIAAILKATFTQFDQKQYDNLCKKMNLPMKKKISEFSSGMKAKLKIISAIAHQPKVLILDEPTAGLDVLARAEIQELLQDYMDHPDRAILISSHIAADLEALCDDFYVISKGKIVLHETIDDLIDQYGVIYASQEDMEKLDPAGMIAREKAPGGWKILVKDRNFYLENYPQLTVEKGNLDDLLLILEGGERQ